MATGRAGAIGCSPDAARLCNVLVASLGTLLCEAHAALHCGDLASDVLMRDMLDFGSPPTCVLVWICMPAHVKLRALALQVPGGTDALLLLPTHQAEAELNKTEQAATKALRKRVAVAEHKENAAKREVARLRADNARLKVSTPAAVLY